MPVNPEQAPTPDVTIAGRLDGLRRNQMVLELRANDLAVQLSQLGERSHRASSQAELDGFAQPLAEAQHRLKAASLEADLGRRQLEALEKEYARATTVAPGSRDPLFGREQLEETGLGVFLLLVPVVFALTRRLWVRRGTHVDQMSVIESSPRLERIEQALESVAIEVERISEAQRFSARLLAERGAEAAEHRSPPRPLSAPWSITPH